MASLSNIPFAAAPSQDRRVCSFWPAVRIAALTLGLLVGTYGTAAAQDVVEPTATQVQLNTQGVEAMVAGQNEAAVGHFKSSLRLGEVNITWLNLGRALSRLGRCGEAREAFAKVPTAPGVASPSRAEIAAVQAGYEAEFAELCPSLRLICTPADLDVYVDGGDAMPCPADSEKLDLDAGSHSILARKGDDTTTVEFELAPGESKTLPITLQASDETAAPSEHPVGVHDEMSALAISGWVLVGVGGASALTGLGYDTFVLGDDIDAYEDGSGDLTRSELSGRQDMVLALGFGGLTLAAAGGAILIADALMDEGSEEDTSVAIVPVVGPEQSGLAGVVRW